ncbi:uncharacterized protein A4U43_C02F16190 [Asparagus officinalis]|uniref:Uncharacterized protein n=1 Tax=Asparagus officinalis TaxID=4686 RepID=A0A5P1FLF6_ASPOF|nr:uncharacterized protein A4U43_C02F16190 [Asparagus officinalis]
MSSLPSPRLAAHATSGASASSDPNANVDGIAARRKHLLRSATYATPQDAATYDYTAMKSLNEAKYGFWGVLARKAKSILEDDNPSQESEDSGRSHPQMFDTSAGSQFNQLDSYQRTDNLSVNKGPELDSSHQHIGGAIKSALEEGMTIVENRTANIIQETRKLQIRRKSGSFSARNQCADLSASSYLYADLNDHETQLKASRDVANAMAAKAKLLLRELKTVKADLAFAKERCAQLEGENKLLRESRDKGDTIEDDDLIRLQLETLLAEKGRLAHDNSIYARENRFLREIVEYHQLTMQDVVYVDEGIEEVQEVCPIQLPAHLFHSSPRQLSPILSRPGSSNNSKNSSPQFLNIEDPPEFFLKTGTFSPSSSSHAKRRPIAGSPTSSPKYETRAAETQPRSVPPSPKHETQEKTKTESRLPSIIIYEAQAETLAGSPQHAQSLTPVEIQQMSSPPSPKFTQEEFHIRSSSPSPKSRPETKAGSLQSSPKLKPIEIKARSHPTSPTYEPLVKIRARCSSPSPKYGTQAETQARSPSPSPKYQRWTEIRARCSTPSPKYSTLEETHHFQKMRNWQKCKKRVSDLFLNWHKQKPRQRIPQLHNMRHKRKPRL